MKNFIHVNNFEMAAIRALLLLPCFLVTSRTVLSQTTQQDLDYFAKYVDLRYEVVDNWVYEANRYLAQVTLRNTGSKPIQNGDWEIYFCNIRKIEAPLTNADPAHLPETYGVRIVHLNGCQHKLEPLDNFTGIEPAAELKIYFTAMFWMVARTDVMPNWYVTAGSLIPRTIASTVGENLDFVVPFLRPNQWSRYKIETGEVELVDQYHPYSPTERYERNRVDDIGEEKVKHAVIPTPRQMTLGSGHVRIITSDWVIVVNRDSTTLRPAAYYLSEVTGIPISASVPSSRVIQFRIATPTGSEIPNLESYTLEVNSTGDYVIISASTTQGAFYGVQTLRHLADDEWRVPDVTVQDSPRFGYRGMHLDVGRNFFSKEQVMLLLDAMAWYKLNKFHFHLSDDEGWRLEIPELPELITIGSKRCHDLEERTCLMSQLGSGYTDQTSGSGYYTVDDYREILRHAALLNIEVIPEFESPGHARSQIKAMLARFENRGGVGGGGSASDYLLHDLNDTSVYTTPQIFNDDAMNPCMESTYRFIDTVISRVADLHNGINPLKTFHFGGDEVGHGAWENSTQCQQFTISRPYLNSTGSLKEYFAKRVIEITNRYRVDAAAWEDGLMDDTNIPYDRSQLVKRDVYAYAWNNIWEWGGGDRAYRLANANYKVVMSQATHLYFDHPYEPDPEERGYYWAPRFTDTKKVFSFMPEHLYRNADVTRAGYPVTTEMLCGENNATCTPLVAANNIVGIQGQLWTETSRTSEQLEGMAFPRMLALAERAWHKAPWEDIQDKSLRSREELKDWTRFANILGHYELAKLDKMGIDYRVPPPGATIVSGRLIVNSAFPGLIVEYSPDDGRHWYTDTDRARKSGRILLRTRSADRRRTSRIIEMNVTASEEPQTTQDPHTAVPCASPYSASHVFTVIIVAAFVVSRRFFSSI